MTNQSDCKNMQPKKPAAKKVIWVLKDDRAGNYSQAIGLAEAMAEISDAKIEIKEIKYNFLAKIPNFLKINGFLGIGKDSKNSLIWNPLTSNNAAKPDIVISAGRKTAPIAAFLKKKFQAFAVQIMNPDFDFKKFDFVVLPKHDKENKNHNVVRVLGALTRVKDGLLNDEYQKFDNILGKITSPKIALLVGGSSKKGNFSNEIAQNLAKLVSSIVNQMQGNLLVLNSRRTGGEITEILDENLKCQKTFFKWQEKNWQNPYFAVLQAADFIIATGDSISMCCEICSLGKPIYIFNPAKICSSKHLQFHQDLFDGKFARQLNAQNTTLEWFCANKLNETKRIAKELLAN